MARTTHRTQRSAPRAGGGKQGHRALPDGRVVCNSHRLIGCPKCVTDSTVDNNTTGGSIATVDNHASDLETNDTPDVEDGSDATVDNNATNVETKNTSDIEDDSDATVDNDVFDVETRNGYEAEIKAMYDLLSPGAKALFCARYGNSPTTHIDSGEESETTMPSVAPSEHLFEKTSRVARIFPAEFTTPSALVKPTELFLRREHGSETR